MEHDIEQNPLRLVEYDSQRRRLWLLGQRCHHGATGALIAAAAVSSIVGARLTARGVTHGITTLAATGSLLMVHDWKDRSIWFERGHGTQP